MAKAAVAGHANSSRCNARRMAPVHRYFMSYCLVDGHFCTKYFHTAFPRVGAINRRFRCRLWVLSLLCAIPPLLWNVAARYCSRNICSNVTLVLSLPLINLQPIGEESSGCGDSDPGRHAQSPNLFELALTPCALVLLCTSSSEHFPCKFFFNSSAYIIQRE